MGIVILILGLSALCVVAIASVYTRSRERARLHEALRLMAEAHTELKKKFEDLVEPSEFRVPTERPEEESTSALHPEITSDWKSGVEDFRAAFEVINLPTYMVPIYLGTKIVLGPTYTCDHVTWKQAARRIMQKANWPTGYEPHSKISDLATLAAWNDEDLESADWTRTYEASRAV